ncbi:AAA domain-containing protein [Chitinophaga sp. GCM10012297]|uniref:AAA family ATPase n=1 Tax=Chitinophaga chungangae TaxID=2821488 RepID=A0ABS3YKT1_9BACT|nr:AAA domain-containing protein [Chitinophaga chungangae]MBO9155309.1 AAA family ATPase [Chitinophaga chungangae]
MDYFARLQELLKIEKEEDKRNYRQLTETSPVAVRRANGLTWYPIAIRGSEMSRGDYLTVEMERTTHQEIVHQLRFGAAAMLFSHHNPKEHHVEGVISWQSGNRLKLTLRTDELPDWADDGKLGVDLLFDDNSYDEMQNALKQAAALAEKTNEGRLVRILTGTQAPSFHAGTPPFQHARLNNSQREAVQMILSANDIAIVHGPPGTGKTTTLVQAIKALIAQQPQQVLVVAPSNTAVDLLSEKLFEEGLNVLRVGNPARVSEKLTALTLDSKIAEHPSSKEIKRLKKQANEFRDMAHKYKRNFGRSEREQRKALFAEARNILKSVENTEQYIIDDVIAKAQVVTATLVGANHYTVRGRQYHTVVIDEAGQALEPACWIPVLKAQKVVLAGDHHQLSPTVKSDEAARKGLSTTLLEKCTALYPEAVVMLEEQYRMHATIMGYSSSIFYKDKLKAHASVADHLLHPTETPLVFVDTAGCGFDEKTEGTSTSNPEEAAFLFKHLRQLVGTLSTHYSKENFPGIAVISPYREQIYLLKEQLEHSPELKAYGDRISVNTIDSFQGQERDVVYISMTRSNTENKIGFLSDVRRMNVAMTRARKKLVVIGDSATLSQFPFYADFIAYAEARDAYRSAWEYMEN